MTTFESFTYLNPSHTPLLMKTLLAECTVLLSQYSKRKVLLPLPSFCVYVNTLHLMFDGDQNTHHSSPLCSPILNHAHDCISVSAVTSPPPSTHRSHQQVGLTVYNISYDAASFRWPTLDDESLSYVTGLVIEYRDDVTEDWNATALMLPTATSHRVTYLMANHKYFARLVALALPTDRISMSSVEFVTTTTYQGEQYHFRYPAPEKEKKKSMKE